MIFNRFKEVWAFDFEFIADSGERPIPVCLCAKELKSGRTVREWLRPGAQAPYGLGPDCLFIAYSCPAELSCHLALGWPLPARLLDLFVEFRNLTNGIPLPCGDGLLGALTFYGLDAMTGAEKTEMRDLVLRGGPWSDTEREAILDYCASDVDALERLLEKMAPAITKRPGDLERAVLRGRYTRAVARMEATGVPICLHELERLRAHWQAIRGRLIEAVDVDFGVYEAGSFRERLFADYLVQQGLPWPRLESGGLALDGDTFREMARAHPKVAPLRELRHTLGEMRLHDLQVGRDGRNRCYLAMFRARTGRNLPSSSRYVFGPSSWLRSLIKPDPGRVLAYIDWSQQEIGIAAALSGDEGLLEAVRSGDPYLDFAVRAGIAPSGANKSSHGAIRDVCKAVVLGTNYGMEAESLAHRIGCAPIVARDLLRKHRAAYPTFWRWSESAVNRFLLLGKIETVFGWQQRINSDVNPRAIRNFPCQASGAEMLRLACSLATERGVDVCGPVHDAILVEAGADEFDDRLATAREAMAEASRAVLGGFELTTDVKVVRWPDRYVDPRGAVMWGRVMGILDGLEGGYIPPATA